LKAVGDSAGDDARIFGPMGGLARLRWHRDRLHATFNPNRRHPSDAGFMVIITGHPR
jgi:hypothetical protein